MRAWHDRVGDLTLFEALTDGAFDVETGNIAGNLTKNFQKSQMPGGLPGGGGMGGFGIDRYIKTAFWVLPNFHECFCDSIETENNHVFYFFKKKPRQKNEDNLLTLIIDM